MLRDSTDGQHFSLTIEKDSRVMNSSFIGAADVNDCPWRCLIRMIYSHVIFLGLRVKLFRIVSCHLLTDE